MQQAGAIDELVETARLSGRIPGIALAVVQNGRCVYARGFGWRDASARLPMQTDTLFPIASTSKAFNATLLGMLVEEGKLAWDAPVRRYLPCFRLQQPDLGERVTVRDLVAMRTGLPGHDYVWFHMDCQRRELIDRVAHLQCSAGVRERFQYNNLTVTIAGHLAEIVTGCSWEKLVAERILTPLGMEATQFGVPRTSNATRGYHENSQRQLLDTPRILDEALAPAGASIHSTVQDMARWIAFNLARGETSSGHQLVAANTLREIHSAQISMSGDPTAPSSEASYALGWFLDSYQGQVRVSHTGHHYDVNCCVTLLPTHSLGVVSFSNFASARLAPVINQCVSDTLLGLPHADTVAAALDRYERKIEATRLRNANVPRESGSLPSRPLNDYVGSYEDRGYGRVRIVEKAGQLVFERGLINLPLEHWHRDAWVVADNDLFEIHGAHAFDRSSPLTFQLSAGGEVEGLWILFEPSVAPILFRRL